MYNYNQHNRTSDYLVPLPQMPQTQTAPQQQRQQSMSMDPSKALKIYNMFSKKGGTQAATSAGSKTGTMSSLSSMFSKGASAGKSGMAALASNPITWIVLAATANEKYMKKKGNRRSGSDYWKDMITGKNAIKDLKYYLKKIF